MKTRKRWVILLLALLFIVGMTVFIVAERAGAPSSEDTLEPTEQIEESDNTEEAGFDKTQYSVDQPGSLWWIVNRDRPLPDGYTPPDLIVPSVRLRLGGGEEQMQFSQQARPSLEAMFEAAADDGVELVFGSGYRSEGLQAQFYNSYAARDGQAAADRYSARPGTSEHQTGLAFDVTSPSGACHLEICFEGSVL
jgi:LAS superfamily LD-carboxypeptidase LdcB